MNLDKIGKFISLCRKKQNLTQEQLSEKLGISDRAISKWERGINLPDASIMIELCEILDITVNELLSGEVIEKRNYMKKAEDNLVKLNELEEKNNKLLLTMEYVIGFISVISFVIIILVAAKFEMNLFFRISLISIACIILAIGIFYGMKLEREVGYYKCNKCHHRYIPRVLPFWLSAHIGRTRYLKCPNCNKYSWNKKLLNK